MQHWQLLIVSVPLSGLPVRGRPLLLSTILIENISESFYDLSGFTRHQPHPPTAWLMRTVVPWTGYGSGGRPVSWWPPQAVHVIPPPLPPPPPHQRCRAQHGQPWRQASLWWLIVKLQQVSEAGTEHHGPPHRQDQAQVVTADRRGE